MRRLSVFRVLDSPPAKSSMYEHCRDTNSGSTSLFCVGSSSHSLKENLPNFLAGFVLFRKNDVRTFNSSEDIQSGCFPSGNIIAAELNVDWFEYEAYVDSLGIKK